MVPPGQQVDDVTASLSVAAVARRLGVAPATLRTWDRRYGLGPSEHQPGSHRRYTAADVARLVIMRRLTLEGVAPVQAAASAHGRVIVLDELAAPGQAREEVPDLARALAAADLTVTNAPGPAAAPAEHTFTAPWSRVAAVDRTPLTLRASPVGADRLQRAALAGDAAACTALVAELASRRGPIAAWEELVEPALHALGRRWEATSPGVDTDALLRAAAMEGIRLLTMPPLRTAAVVVIAASEHELAGAPLHALAAAVRADGVRAWVLAAGLPREAVAAAVRRTGPLVLVLHADRLVTDAATQLAGLPRLRAPSRLVLSGRGWSHAHVPGGRPVLHAADLRRAAELVAEATAP